MNQLYAEAGVKRKGDAKLLILRILLILGIVLGAFCILIGDFFVVIGMAIIVAMVLLFPMLSMEYEYIFVDGQFDFDRISGKSKRKTILRVDMDQIEIIAPKGSHALDGYNNTESVNLDFSSGDNSRNPFIIIAGIEDKKYRIAFEPTEKMLSMIKQKSPRKLAQY